MKKKIIIIIFLVCFDVIYAFNNITCLPGHVGVFTEANQIGQHVDRKRKKK